METQASHGFIPQSSHLQVKFRGYPNVLEKELPVVGMPQTCSILPRQSPPPAPSKRAEETFETPKIDVSVERLVFLERVERLMANEARIKELEAETKSLLSTIAKLGFEIENLKKPKA